MRLKSLIDYVIVADAEAAAVDVVVAAGIHFVAVPVVAN